MTKPKRNNYCYAPGCKTGYSRQKNATKCSLFSVPADKQLRQVWERNLRRSDRPLDETCAVCELHFEPEYIVRDYVHVIAGKEVRTPRGKPTLAPGAVPTILPNLPERLSRRAPPKRRDRKRPHDAAFPTTKTRTKTSRQGAEQVECSIVDEPARSVSCDAAKEVQANQDAGLHSVVPLDINLPSKFWTRQLLPDVSGVVYSVGSLASEPHVDILTEKLVVFSSDHGGGASETAGKVYLRGKLHCKRSPKTREEAETLLADVDKLNLCKGALKVEDLATSAITSSIWEQGTVLSGTYFSKKCNGSSPKRGEKMSEYYTLKAIYPHTVYLRYLLYVAWH